MHRKPSGAKTAGIVITAALLVFGVLLAAFLTNVKGSKRDAIVLPDAAVQPQPPVEETPTADLFLQVDRNNVQKILKTLQRPAAYHQSLLLTTLWDGGSGTKPVEIWCNGSLLRAQITESGRKRHVLTDGVSAWIWYDAERSAVKFTLGQTRTLDDLIGAASYETVIGLALDDITDGGFISPEELGPNCLYVKTAADADGYSTQYWIDVATQLLCKAETTQNAVTVYQLRQSAFEALTPDDDALLAMMTLPDGVAVTAQ